MGADIHAAVECFANGRWHFHRALDLGRNYHLFSILAGVRGNHEPIADPRGLPADLDPHSVTDTDRVGDTYYENGHDFGDHSFSWLTLAELRAYDWGTRLIDTGCIPLRDVDRRGAFDTFYKETYAEWIQSAPHPPKGWCGGLSGAELLDLRPREFMAESLSHSDAVDRHEARRVIAKCQSDLVKATRYLADPSLFPEPEGPPPGAIYGGGAWKRNELRPRTAWAYVAWSLTAREACEEFCTWLDETRDLPGEETRLVFGFDS